MTSVSSTACEDPELPVLGRLGDKADVLGFLQRHLANLQGQRAHPNRRLHYDQMLIALLVSAYDPCLQSLRTLDDASVSQSYLRDHLGSRRLAKSTLSDALSSMNPEALLPLLKQLMARVPSLQRRDPDLACLQRLIALDGTYFRVPSEVLWALAHKDVNHRIGRNVRLNVQLDVLEFVPVGVSLSGDDGQREPRAFLAQGLRSGAVYLADRAFVEKTFLRGVLEAGSDLVVRLLANTRFNVLQEQALTPEDQQAHVIADRLGHMPAVSRPGHGPLREVVVIDPRKNKPVRLLTSLLHVPAHVIGKLYRYRWQIELFFRWLKCVARIRHVMSQSRNGMTLQFYAAMIAVLAGYLVSGTRPGRYEYNLLTGVIRGTTLPEGMLEVLARRTRERELERLRRDRKKSA